MKLYNDDKETGRALMLSLKSTFVDVFTPQHVASISSDTFQTDSLPSDSCRELPHRFTLAACHHDFFYI